MASLSFVFSHDQASSFNLQACRFASTGGMLALHKGYYAKHPTASLHSVTSREACTHLVLSAANPGSTARGFEPADSSRNYKREKS
jgi:hypothetical protein